VSQATSSVRPSVVIEWDGARAGRRLDDIVREEPFEIRADGVALASMMRTPGQDEELAAGFLLSEGVIHSRADLLALESTEANVVEVRLAPDVAADLGRFVRHFTASSACGVCGRATIETARSRRFSIPAASTFAVGPRALSALPGSLAQAQPVFARTGGLHAAALFDATGRIVMVREDIGRHNAVDKIVGAALLADRVPVAKFGLLVSGRGGFEIVQKALAAGIPMVACISAPSSLAVQLAREAGQTLIGFLRGPRFVVYAGERRIPEVGESGDRLGAVLAAAAAE
jgi:FdhD protein